MSDSGKAVFLSYASQDAEPARRICEALRAAGVEVWFDQSELRGGDAWDAKIRKQIKECALFVPVISENTNARPEGYFRLEWKLAVDRSHLIADDHAFLVPVIIGEIPEAAARVPDRFRDVQWTRIVLAETPVAFAERMQVLLRGAAPEAPAKARGRSERKSAGASVWWGRLVPLAGLAFGLIFVLRPMWSSATRKRPAAPPKIEKPAVPVVSEAQRLVAKARDLYAPWEGATRGDFALAEQLVSQAIELDQSDGEAWAARSIINYGYVMLGHDSAPTRIETTRSATERAMQLAPQSPHARAAQAFYYQFQPATRAEAQRLLRELADEPAADALVLRIYAQSLRVQRKFDEALTYVDRAAALPGEAGAAAYSKSAILAAAGRYDEAEATVDRALAENPTAYLYRVKAGNLMLLHGELEQAGALVAKVPPAFLLEDRGAYWAAQLWLWRRNGDKCLAMLAGVSRDVLECQEFRGPKAFIAGQAHRVAGRPAAAKAEWAEALRVAERELAAQPSAIQWVHWKARLLAALERPAEAELVLKTFEQLRGATGVTNDTIPIYLLLGRKSEVLEVMEQNHATVAAAKSEPQLAAFQNNLRFNVEWDTLREEPRFVALLGGAKAP